MVWWFALTSPCGKKTKQAFNVAYVFNMFLICFKTNHVKICKSTPLLSMFFLKLQLTKGSLKKRGLKLLVFRAATNDYFDNRLI